MPILLGVRHLMNINISKYSLFKEYKIDSLTLLSTQGFSNKNYRFDYQNSTYLLRKFILSDRDRELEYKIQTLAYEQGIAAKPFLLDIDNDLMICEFLEGEHKEILSREELKQLVKVLKKLHAVKIDSENMEISTLFSVQNKEVEEAFTILEKYPNEMVLCHNDLNPKNILFSSYDVKFIDWEFAGMNDLYFDLASVSVEFELSVLDEAYFLANYFLMDGWNKDKLEAYKVIYKDLCKQWFKENT
ncbi:MAG TPA: DUF1679 domain-containing protein [bacterium (Candidatus Stahlbacteria)]|nr:DUF1679 domain-containing protein [Candidatus Stahlbacteria bacterium]